MEKTLDAYLKELVDIAHSTSKDGDDAMASIFMLDSLGPLMEKIMLRKKGKLWMSWMKSN